MYWLVVFCTACWQFHYLVILYKCSFYWWSLVPTRWTDKRAYLLLVYNFDDSSEVAFSEAVMLLVVIVIVYIVQSCNPYSFIQRVSPCVFEGGGFTRIRLVNIVICAKAWTCGAFSSHIAIYICEDNKAHFPGTPSALKNTTLVQLQ